MPSIEIKIPGSKSITNRALILASLSKETTILKNSAICDDTIYMIKALKKLGIEISVKNSQIKIKGNNGKFLKQKNKIKIYTENAGTTTRFITALATLTKNEIIIDGNKQMQKRPIKELIKSLNNLGANIKSKTGCPPIHIYPSYLKGGKTKIKGNISSQYISALLMISPFAEKNTTIEIEQKLYSKPYIKTTLALLKKFKINIENKKFTQFKIKGNQKSISPKKLTIESDASSASYIGAYVAINKEKQVLLKNIFKNSIQGDIKFLDYLKQMGCEIKENKKGTIIKSPKKNLNRNLQPINENSNFLHNNTDNIFTKTSVNMNETPDLVMTFAILALFTPGETLIKDIKNLRIKETNRLKALENELKKLKVKVKTGKDYIKIKGEKSIGLYENKKPITIETYDDHRIAMCFGIIQDFFPNIKIKNPKCVSKSYTTFWEDLNKLKTI